MITRTAARPRTDLRAALGLRRGSWGRRILLHHLPIALASVAVLLLFMGLPAFINSDSHGDISSGAFPREPTDGTIPGGMVHGGDESQPMEHGGDQGTGEHGGDQGGSADHEGQGQGSGADGGEHGAESEPGSRNFIQRLAISTGYIGVGLLALTLLIGPANLLLRRRNPVSSYLRRDLGTWVVIASAGHVVVGVLSYDIGILDFFVDNGAIRTSSFGWGNWAGLGALVIMAILLALSADSALRELKARTWKYLQRLNYALIVLAVLHAFFYGALLRATSPFTLVLIVTVFVVLVGQMTGILLWRRRQARGTPVS